MSNTLLPEILEHYNKGTEDERLSKKAYGVLEKIRTQDILLRYLPKAPSNILDIGGGSGVYSYFLAQKGYEVHLVDPVPLHIEQAEQKTSSEGVKLQDYRVADARDLSFVDNGSLDVVLMLGPLYHLPDKEDRAKALNEAYRVLKPGGKIFAAGISSFAVFMDAVSKNDLEDELLFTMAKQSIYSGHHKNLYTDKEYFTTAYFHKPEELLNELDASSFSKIELLGVEGPIWHLSDLEQSISRPDKLMELLRLIEKERSIVGASAHIMCIGEKYEE